MKQALYPERSKAAIGLRLRLTREALGIQQDKFAIEAGVAPGLYNQYEMGKKRPSVDSANKLVDTYDLSLDWIFRADPSNIRVKTAQAIKSLEAARDQEN